MARWRDGRRVAAVQLIKPDYLVVTLEKTDKVVFAAYRGLNSRKDNGPCRAKSASHSLRRALLNATGQCRVTLSLR